MSHFKFVLLRRVSVSIISFCLRAESDEPHPEPAAEGQWVSTLLVQFLNLEETSSVLTAWSDPCLNCGVVLPRLPLRASLICWITAKADALKEKHGGQLTYYSLDISNADTILPSFQTALRNLRYPLRGLVACAGISDGDATVDFSLDRVKRLLDVNVTGTFACAQAVAITMSERPDISGSIVLIASMSGHGSNLVRLFEFRH